MILQPEVSVKVQVSPKKGQPIEFTPEEIIIIHGMLEYAKQQLGEHQR
jgi:hypothetical protein